MSRVLVRVIASLIIAAAMWVASGRAFAGISCPTGQSDRLVARSASSTNQQCTPYQNQNTTVLIDKPSQVTAIVTACGGTPGTQYGNTPFFKVWGPVTTVDMGGGMKRAYQTLCWYPSCAEGGQSDTLNQVKSEYSCGASTCPQYEGGYSVLTMTGTAPETLCARGCTATKSSTSLGLVIGSPGGSASVGFQVYDWLPGAAACSQSAPVFDPEVDKVTSPDGDTMTMNDEGEPVIKNLTGAESPLELPDNFDAGQCTVFNGPEGWGIACNQDQPQSPPQPDNGTPSVPATPEFVLEGEGEAIDWNVYPTSAGATSSTGYGGPPTPGGGSGEGTGGENDEDCIGAQCDDALAGGGDCTAPPTCSGDPIGCFQAVQEWKQSCALTGATDGNIRDGGDAGIADGIDSADEGQLEDEEDVSTWLPTPSGSGCSMSDAIVNLLGSSIPIKISFLCPLFVVFGQFVLIAASIFGFKIVAGGVL